MSRWFKQAKCVVACMICISISFLGRTWAAGSMSLIPFSCCDGQFRVTTMANGQTVWQNVSGSTYFYFDVPSRFSFTPGKPVYLKVTYYDEGYGTVWVQYDSAYSNASADAYYRSEMHTRSSRVNTRTLVNSYHELSLPKFAGRQNGNADFRLSLWAGENVPLSVAAVTIQNTSFDDPQFLYVLSRPWLGPYTGPTRDYVDRSTLNHKVMVGYQGWFRTPNDLADKGWSHWCQNGVMTPANFNVDMWPDLTEYGPNELFQAAEVVTRSGKPASLFSSATPETVRRHFQWMRKYNIDGAFLQRFVHSSSSGAWGHEEWVLHHIREAANREGRIWAIEYDVCALAKEPNPYEVIVADWKWLVDAIKVRQDPRYAYEGGKPVVFVWGLAYPGNGFSRTTADRIVDFFKHDAKYGGNYVIGGIPWWWADLTDWYDHFRRYDGTLAWMPASTERYVNDFQTFTSWGVDYFPHVHPGFSWANMQHQTGNQDYEPRQKGAFLWTRIRAALAGGGTRLFIGMFDEYDEGTAIMPMSDDPPNPPPQWGRFLTNEGRPSDWWMLLAGEARGLLLGHRSDSIWMPTEQELSNRSNIGPEAWIDLGISGTSDQLYHKAATGGTTQSAVYAGRQCVSNAVPGADRYCHFDIDSAFASREDHGLDVTVEVEYCDSPGAVTFRLEYDSVGGAYTPHSLSVRTQGTGEWRTARFEIADAYFGNRQTGAADFRLAVAGSGRLYVDRLWVRRVDREPPVDEDEFVLHGRDIGTVLQGRDSFADGVYTVVANGADIWGIEDGFRYVYAAMTGDGELSARVWSLQNTNSWAKAGVMIRETLDPESRYAFMCVTPQDGEGRFAFQCRPMTAGHSSSFHSGQHQVSYASNTWVKIKRQGDAFTGLVSQDGHVWETFPGPLSIWPGDPLEPNPVAVNMTQTVYVGLAVTSHSAGQLCTAKFDHISFQGNVALEGAVAAMADFLVIDDIENCPAVEGNRPRLGR